MSFLYYNVEKMNVFKINGDDDDDDHIFLISKDLFNIKRVSHLPTLFENLMLP